MKTYFVDSFTAEPFKGNPAGVCFPETGIGEATMLDIAKEIGFSETAFVQKTDGEGNYSICYYSPKKEILLCGHATLGAAKVIFQNTELSQIHFTTVHGVELTTGRAGQGISMSFPIYGTTPHPPVPAAMLLALGLKSVVATSFNAETNILLLEIADPSVLAALRPDFTALLKSYEGIDGVLVTAPGNGDGLDFHYRYFWPWAGTNEDPVTGVVQTFLAKYWSEKLGKKQLRVFQSSERTGLMTVEVGEDKVVIIGQAVIVLEGDLLI